MGDPSHDSDEDNADPNEGGDTLFETLKRVMEKMQPKTHSETVKDGKAFANLQDQESSGHTNSSSGWGSDEISDFEDVVGDRVWPTTSLHICVPALLAFTFLLPLFFVYFSFQAQQRRAAAKNLLGGDVSLLVFLWLCGFCLFALAGALFRFFSYFTTRHSSCF